MSRPSSAAGDGELAARGPRFARLAGTLGAERRTALRESAWALLLSRLLVWAAAIFAVLVVGVEHDHVPLEIEGLLRGHWHLDELLAAPALRWDGGWYYGLAQHGYAFQAGAASTASMAFFPLYPLCIAALMTFGVSTALAGVLVALAALLAALYCLHRLALLEFGRRETLPGGGDRGARAATLSVLLVALAPMSFFFSAVYAESLLLALSVACLLCARRGQWALSALFGALAGVTRSPGLLLIVPVLILYLYGPRADRTPDRDRGLAPRYRLRRDVLWLALMPSLFVAFCVYLNAHGASLLAPFDAQQYWFRSFAGPFAALWDGVPVVWHALGQVLGLGPDVVTRPWSEIYGMAFLILALVATVAMARALPVAYTVYVVVAIAFVLSAPVAPEPLLSVPRFLLPLFPLFMWGGWALAPRRRLTAVVLVSSSLLLALFSGMFAIWAWVA